MVKFVIKNEEQINKTKVCDIILSNDDICKAFL